MGMIIGCSDGSIEIGNDGKVIENRSDYPDIVEFDLAEYRTWCRANGLIPSEGHEDILLLGYWNRDGSYEPGEPDARTECLLNYRCQPVPEVSEDDQVARALAWLKSRPSSVVAEVLGRQRLLEIDNAIELFEGFADTPTILELEEAVG